MIYNNEKITLAGADFYSSGTPFALSNEFEDVEDLRYQVSLARDPEDLVRKVLHGTKNYLKKAEVKYDYPTHTVLLLTAHMCDNKYYLKVRKV